VDGSESGARPFLFRNRGQFFRRIKEGIDRADIAEFLVFLKVFCEKVETTTDLSGGYYQRVPPGKLESILDEPCSFRLGYLAPGSFKEEGV
jgi:hypothetical protein